MPKEAFVNLRITEAEKGALEEAARILGVSQSEVVRRHGVEQGVAIGNRSLEARSPQPDAA